MTDIIKHTYHTVYAYTVIAFTLNNSEKTVFVTIEFDFPNTISMQLSVLELFLWDDYIKITLGNRT